MPVDAAPKPRRLMLVGPPGAGKGTQGHMLAVVLHVPHVSTGNLIRDAIACDTLSSRRFSELIDNGEFIPDSDVVEIVAKRLALPDAESGYVLDGFPRTVAQAELFRSAPQAERLDKVVALTIPASALVERLSGRLTCVSCGATYHVKHRPPRVQGICDVCGHGLIRRSDDEPDAVRQRLEMYAVKTEPVIAYYGQRDGLVQVDATGTPEQVFGRVMLALGLGTYRSLPVR